MEIGIGTESFCTSDGSGIGRGFNSAGTSPSRAGVLGIFERTKDLALHTEEYIETSVLQQQGAAAKKKVYFVYGGFSEGNMHLRCIFLSRIHKVVGRSVGHLMESGISTEEYLRSYPSPLSLCPHLYHLTMHKILIHMYRVYDVFTIQPKSSCATLLLLRFSLRCIG